MVIRLNCLQITQFWDVIKYALQQVERIGTEESLERFNLIFASLLADKAQCFIKHEDNKIIGVMITETVENKYTGIRNMNIVCLYAYRFIDLNVWQDTFEIVKKLAISEMCKSITFQSKHQRILDIANNLGFNLLHNTMAYQLEV